MEEEYKQVDKEYIKGFNEGYTLAKYMPDTADKVAEAVEGSGRSLGFIDGWKEYQIEKSQERLPDWLKEDRKPSRTEKKPKDIERE